MAKCKRSSKRRQPKQSANSPQPKHELRKKSRHDKRERLQRRNAKRKKTTKAKVPLTGAMQAAVSWLQKFMDRRIAFRLAKCRIVGLMTMDGVSSNTNAPENELA